MAVSSSSERPYGYILYALVALLALGELVILVLALSPDVHPVYRAYFIDRTTTCLPRRVSGTYELGREISFRPDGAGAAAEIKACGWSGPAGDGTHSIGTSSRFRIDLATQPGDLVLTLEMTAGRIVPQRVVVSVNGIKIGTMTATSPTASTAATFMIPASVTAGADVLDITLAYPDAFLPRPRANEVHSRAVKLLTFRLARAAG